MQRSVRPSTPADAPALSALFAAAGLRPSNDPRSIHWKYWQQRDDWQGPRSWVLVSGGELVGHAAMVPGTLAWGAHRERTAHVIDWAARPGDIGAGVTLMKHVGRQVDSLLAIGGSADTLRILPHIGFRPMGVVTGYVRPLHPSRMLHGADIKSWKLWARFARNMAWKAAALASAGPAWESRPVTSDDEFRRLADVLPTPSARMGVLGRTVDLFHYMLSCPIVPMRLYCVASAERVRGYFLLASTPGQVRIADCWVDSTRPTDWLAMMTAAVRQALREPKAIEAVAWASDPLLAQTLNACGFHARYQTPAQLRAGSATAVPDVPVRIQMLDNDASYLNEGTVQLWA